MSQKIVSVPCFCVQVWYFASCYTDGSMVGYTTFIGVIVRTKGRGWGYLQIRILLGVSQEVGTQFLRSDPSVNYGKRIAFTIKSWSTMTKNSVYVRKIPLFTLQNTKYKEIYRHQTKNLLIIVDKAHDIKNIDKYALHTRI